MLNKAWWWHLNDNTKHNKSQGIWEHYISSPLRFLSCFHCVFCILYSINQSLFLNNTLKFIIRYTLKAYLFLVGACVQNKCPLQRARYASDCLKRSSKIGNEVVFLFSLALCSLKVLHVLLIMLTFHNWITTVIWYTLMYIYMCFLK